MATNRGSGYAPSWDLPLVMMLMMMLLNSPVGRGSLHGPRRRDTARTAVDPQMRRDGHITSKSFVSGEEWHNEKGRLFGNSSPLHHFEHSIARHN